MTTKLIYPTLDLFVYVVRNDLRQNAEEVKQNRESFKQLLPSTIDNQQFDQLDEFGNSPDFQELLGQERFIFWWPADHKLDSNKENDWCYPVRLGDSYGVQFESPSMYSQSAEDLIWLTRLKVPFDNQVIERIKSISPKIRLGHTWMFLTAVSLSDPEEIESLAKQCYERLMPNFSDWKDALVAPPGHFLDATVFELEATEREHLLMMF